MVISQSEVWWADLPAPIGSGPAGPGNVVVLFGASTGRDGIARHHPTGAVPPFLPSALAAGSLPEASLSSLISPVRIFAVLIAAATVSAGRFWPCGPFGI